MFTDYTELPTLQTIFLPSNLPGKCGCSSLCFQLPSSTLAGHTSQSEFCRTSWVLLLHALVETHLDGSTGPYALLSYCSLHGISRVQPSLWHCLAKSNTAHQPVILQSAHSPRVLQDGSQLALFILAMNCNSQSWLAAAQTRDKISLQVVHFHYVQSPNVRITELHCKEYYERGQIFSSSV